jgi:hypothetical protein
MQSMTSSCNTRIWFLVSSFGPHLRAKRHCRVVYLLVDGRKSTTHLVPELHNLRLDSRHPLREVLQGRHLHFEHLNTLREIVRRHTDQTTTVASSARMFNGIKRRSVVRMALRFRRSD